MSHFAVYNMHLHTCKLNFVVLTPPPNNVCGLKILTTKFDCYSFYIQCTFCTNELNCCVILSHSNYSGKWPSLLLIKTFKQ